MRGIGGNINGVLQTATMTRNAIGEPVQAWTDAMTLHGWLDLSGGDARYSTFDAKIQESTHVFLCDFVDLNGIAAENARMVIDGKRYDVTLIDNPMGMRDGSQLEIFLRYTGGQ